MIVLLVASLASILGALDLELDRAPVGTWSEYEVAGAGMPLFVRIAAIADEPEGRWIELWISQRPGSASQAYRALVDARPGGALEVRRVLARWGGGAVHEIEPRAFLRGAGSTPRSCKGRCPGKIPPRRNRRLGRIETRAGSFDASERTAGTGTSRIRIVAAEKLPFGGMLSLELAHLRIELLATGRDARSAIPPDAVVTPLPGSAP